ncbi:P-loop containing nucleoside triphosphate hydrolase protein [Suillus ampliporus]|nr:P-loop containing nucleoside triphosphate hydrolase protein [Suillus ampliporus]
MNAQHGDLSLDSLMGKAQDVVTFLPDELSYLAEAFAPSQPESSRSKAYLVLSAFCQGTRSQNSQEFGSNDSATEILEKVFQPLIISRISNHQEQDVIVVGLSFFSALFHVDWQSASHVFAQDGMVEYVTDALDLFPSSASVSLEVARMIGQASGHKACRALIPEEIITWLGNKSHQATDKNLRAAAAIALVKLSRGAATDVSEGADASQAPSSTSKDMELANLLKRMVVSDKDSLSSLNDVVEGLAYLSVDSDVKQALANDPKFLQQLFTLVPRRKPLPTSASNSSLLFGILLIISNLCTYRPRLSQEDAQVAKLKRMAKAGNGSNTTADEPPNALEDDVAVKSRCRQVLASGALDVLSVASGVESQGIRLALGKIYLSIVEDKDNRGKVLQSGGARSLSRVIQSSSSSTSSSTPIDASLLPAIQALAKLTITSSPLQVFGPTDGAMLDAIRPLSHLLLHSSSNLLQQFEALMALTNLASQSTGCADRISSTPQLLNKIELLMMEDHTLIRRAATELICNLVGGAEKVFSRYGGSPDVHATKSKLQVLLAMSDMDDLPTRLAASGALAIVTSASTACQAVFELQLDHHRAFSIIARLIDPSVTLEDNDPDDGEAAGNPGLVHRGVVCLRNILNPQYALPRVPLAEEVEKAGLVNVMARLLKLSRSAISKKAGKKTAPKSAGATKVAKADWKEGFKKKQSGVSDMTLLTTIGNDSINDNLRKRWTAGEIYTYIGGVLISVNPFKGEASSVQISISDVGVKSCPDLGIYTDETLQKYKGKNRLEVPPHVFSIAESAYYNMNAYHENQCVIISGESGAGKTEAAKRIMQYIAAVSGGEDNSIQEIKEMVLATNPLLESFGCAKTLRNNNSSRHGKYLEIMFNNHGEPIGAQITNYLLEKGRVVGQIENERNFHIFYQFTKAASDEQREQFGLQGPDAYSYTSMSNCLDVQDINDSNDYADTLNAMRIIGLSDQEQNEIFRMLAIILWLGNVQFQEMDDGNATISDTGVTDFIAYLMEVDSSMVQKVLTSKVVETQRGGRRGSVYDVPLNPAQATAGRDALTKAIYNNLFEWIVSRINVSMKARSATAQVIGILDIFGFEIFENNSFEQLCINYVNEKLQQIFIELTLKTEQEEYVREQIKWTPINYFNNKIVCDLIEERKPPGIFAALNDACATAHADPAAADNSFVQRTAMLSSNAHFEARGAQFLVRHYAGDVMYNIAGMTDKNKDALVKDLFDLVGSSGNQFLQTLFSDRPDPSSKKRPPTAGDRIKASAGALVDNLMKAQPSYIRTIKPNQNRSATQYDTKAILHQIKYLGLEENIRVRRAGFAYRNTFEKMVERFYLLSPSTSYAGEYTWQGDAKSGCEQILKDTGIAKDEWQMGVTKAFIKNPETLFALETMRDRYWHNMAARIQRAWRNYWRYKNECARRIQRFWKNNKEALEYAKVRDYGHQVLAGRKERRRYSLLSYRRFLGDYLDVNGKGIVGSDLRSACGLGAEQATFSSKVQILVSKFGRSSKPDPRFLVVTAKAVYIAVTSRKDGQIQTSLERKIPLITIKSISMSTLRDDWLALNCNASEEGDPVLHCHFKTELTANLLTLTQASINVLIGPSIEYAKKKDKKAHIQFVKDETVAKDDVYKSHTVHVSSGEPPSSTSRPAAKRKPGIVRPITQGKLLRAGGPSDKLKTSRSKPASHPLPGRSAPPAAVKPTPVASPKSAPVPPTRNSVPPPPPPPPKEPDVDLYKAKFAFEGQEGEISLKKDDIVELVEKDDNGWWLVRKDGQEGWAPNNYLELVPPKAKAARPPPARLPPPPAPPAAVATAPSISKPTVSVISAKSLTADSSAKPVAVFPGLAPSNGSAAPWKKPASANGSSGSTPANSRPSSSLGAKPPPVAIKPKPAPPPVASKPSGGKPPPKPPMPTAPRPGAGVAPPKAVSKPSAPAGQLDLAAALAKRAQKIADE